MAIFTHIGPRGGRYRVENGRKVYDAPYARDRRRYLSSAANTSPAVEPPTVEASAPGEEESKALGFWGVVWFLVALPFRFLGFCIKHGKGYGLFFSFVVVLNCILWALQGVELLFSYFAGMLQAAHFIG